MALLLCPSPPLCSFKLRKANFHPMPFSGKPPMVVRRLAKYHRSAICQYSSHGDSSTSELPQKPPIPTWDNRFIESLDECHTESEAFNKIRIEELKEEVKNMFIYSNDPLQKIKLVDVIERLGLAYHFDKEIHSTLRQVYDDNEDFGDNLQAIALRFLLLRQHGYNVSCDVFEKFKDKEGNFKQSLKTDIMGLLSLYEASHFSIRGEDILDNSLTFTRQELSMAIHLDPTIARRVQRSLELPPQRGMPGLEVKHFISFYEDDESRNDVLLKLAKMDFNLLQSLYRSEIKKVFRWWKELDIGEKLPYARDRVVDCYMWAIGINFLPDFSNGRIALAKLVNLIILLDDIYDTFGKFEEMQHFSDAIERWDIQAIDQLPEYLRKPYITLYNFANDFEYMSLKHRENNSIYYVKKIVSMP